jgi:hypothetical protein
MSVFACPATAGAGCSTWSIQCLSILNAAGNPPSGLVDANGMAMSSFNNGTWGIDYATCQKFCNTTAIPLVRASSFDFEMGSNSYRVHTSTSSHFLEL